MLPSFICSYCGIDRPDVERSREHLIPAAIGGKFTTRNVCHDCNQWVGRQIDKPWLSDTFIRSARHRFKITDRFGNLVAAPEVYGTIDGGPKMKVTMVAEGGWEQEVIPGIEELPDGTLRITASPDDHEAVTAMYLKRLAAKYPGHSFEVSGEPVREKLGDRFGDSWLRILHSRSLMMWPRFGAKFGLAFGREMLGEEWAVSEAADRLRATLRDEDKLTSIHDPYYLQLEGGTVMGPMKHLFPSPRHAVWLFEHHGEIHLTTILFGERSYTVPLGRGQLDSQPLWWSDPTSTDCEQTTYDQYVRAQTERMVLSGGADAFIEACRIENVEQAGSEAADSDRTS